MYALSGVEVPHTPVLPLVRQPLPVALQETTNLLLGSVQQVLFYKKFVNTLTLCDLCKVEVSSNHGSILIIKYICAMLSRSDWL